jgi:hypothetical protein
VAEIVVRDFRRDNKSHGLLGRAALQESSCEINVPSGRRERGKERNPWDLDKQTTFRVPITLKTFGNACDFVRKMPVLFHEDRAEELVEM